MEESRRAWAFMIRSMLADQPYSPVREAAGGVSQTVGHLDLLDLVSKSLLVNLAELLSLSLQLLKGLLLILGLIVKHKAILGHTHQFVTIEFLQLLHSVLVNWVHHVDHLQATLLQLLSEGAVLDSSLAFASDVVDAFLALLHARDVVLETSELFLALGCVVAHELGELSTVAGVLVDAKLEVLTELLPEL